ncbi:Allene oxide synthase [Nymphaea thermarum]|nr:Allene oxide synthase [Nymphaea thermarum]
MVVKNKLTGSTKNSTLSYVKTYGGQAPEIAENEFGITKEEAVHNLIFMFGLNSVAGFSLFLPARIKHIADQGIELVHNLIFMFGLNSVAGFSLFLPARIKHIADQGIELHNGRSAINAMPMLKSVVDKALRIQPPVPRQYARARNDFIIESHEARFLVKKGELQPFAMKDPKLFDRPTEFLPDRFVGEEGEKLIGRVWWSNGPEEPNPDRPTNFLPDLFVGEEGDKLIGRLVVQVWGLEKTSGIPGWAR